MVSSVVGLSLVIADFLLLMQTVQDARGWLPHLWCLRKLHRSSEWRVIACRFGGGYDIEARRCQIHVDYLGGCPE